MDGRRSEVVSLKVSNIVDTCTENACRVSAPDLLRASSPSGHEESAAPPTSD
jgi:hypothetical protein